MPTLANITHSYPRVEFVYRRCGMHMVKAGIANDPPNVHMHHIQTPHGNYDNFELLLENKILDLYQNRIPDIIICGDINIDWNSRTSGETKKYKAFLKGMGLSQGIKDATHSTVHSTTTIDHIITNWEELYCTYGVIPLGISDHDLVFVSRKKEKIPHTFSYIECRSYIKFDAIAFQREIDEYNWDDVMMCNDVNTAVELFNREFIKLVNKHAPFKHLKMLDNALGWLNRDMLAHINEREYWSKNSKNLDLPGVSTRK